MKHLTLILTYILFYILGLSSCVPQSSPQEDKKSILKKMENSEWEKVVIKTMEYDITYRDSTAVTLVMFQDGTLNRIETDDGFELQGEWDTEKVAKGEQQILYYKYRYGGTNDIYYFRLDDPVIYWSDLGGIPKAKILSINIVE